MEPEIAAYWSRTGKPIEPGTTLVVRGVAAVLFTPGHMDLSLQAEETVAAAES